VRGVGDAKLDWKGRKEFAREIYRSQRDEKRCPDFCHEVRYREKVERLQDSEAYEHVHDEDAGDVRAADFQNAGTELADGEEKRDGENQDGKSARVDAVNEGRRCHQREKPSSAVG